MPSFFWNPLVEFIYIYIIIYRVSFQKTVRACVFIMMVTLTLTKLTVAHFKRPISCFKKSSLRVQKQIRTKKKKASISSIGWLDNELSL
jgi:hypothetical protein